jgi:hypothetical protein
MRTTAHLTSVRSDHPAMVVQPPQPRVNPSVETFIGKVQEFKKNQNVPDNSEDVNQLAQWFLDNCEPEPFKRLLQTGRITQLRLSSDEALTCLEQVVHSSENLHNVQFSIELLADADAGGNRMDRLVEVINKVNNVRKLHFAGSENTPADRGQLERCFDLFQKTPHLDLDVSTIDLDLPSTQRLMASLSQNASIEGLGYEALTATLVELQPLQDCLTDFVAKSALTSLRLNIRLHRAVHLMSTLSRSTHLVDLDLRDCILFERDDLSAHIRHGLPNIKRLVLPGFDTAAMTHERCRLWSDNIMANGTLKVLDVSESGIDLTYWAQSIGQNTNLEKLVLSSCISEEVVSLDEILGNMSKNKTLKEIEFRHPGQKSAGDRDLTESEKEQIRLFTHTNRMELIAMVSEKSGPVLGLLAKTNELVPHDVAPIITRHVGAQELKALKLVCKATSSTYDAQVAPLRDELSRALEKVDQMEFGSVCQVLNERGWKLSPAMAIELIRQEEFPQLLARALEAGRLSSLLRHLGRIGVAPHLLSRALSVLNLPHKVVLDEIELAGVSLHPGFDALRRLGQQDKYDEMPAVKLFINHGVLLESGPQHDEIVLWCSSRNQPEVLVAAASHSKSRKLTIRGSDRNFSRLVSAVPLYPGVRALALAGSLSRDVPTHLANLLANCGSLKALELRVECSGSNFLHLMAAIGANGSISDLVISKPAAMEIDAWCDAVEQLLSTGKELVVTLDLPDELQNAKAVLELSRTFGGRIDDFMV